MVWGYPTPRRKASLRPIPCNGYQDKQIEVIVRSYSQNQHCDETLGGQDIRMIISTISIVQLSFLDFGIPGIFLPHLCLCSWYNIKNSQTFPFPVPSSEKGPEQAGIFSDCPCLDREDFILLSLGTFASVIYPPPDSAFSVCGILIQSFSLSFCIQPDKLHCSEVFLLWNKLVSWANSV